MVEAFSAFSFRRAALTGIADPEQLRLVRATPEFFQVVRPEPIVGRVFAPTQAFASHREASPLSA